MSAPTALTRLGDAILGARRHQRQRIARMLLTWPMAAACLALIHFAVRAGWCEPARAWWLTAYVAAGLALFYGLLRGPWTWRHGDPELVLERVVFALGALLMTYAWAGPVRDCALVLLAGVMVLALFSLPPRQTRVLSVLAMLALGATVITLSQQQAQSQPFAPGLLHWALTSFCLVGLGVVARQVEQLRHKLVRQKAELQLAVQRVQRLGQHDALTGLINRRHMFERIDHELKRQARATGPTACVAMVDLDWFKRINDSHGHAAGDQVLRNFALLASSVLRSTDTIARWGGEEFLILLPCTGLAQALLTLERLRHQASITALAESVPQLQVTVSIGVAQHRSQESLEQWLERADQAMYAAKAAGRNAVRAVALEC